MGRFEEIIGQERAAEHLKMAVQEGKVSHAYLIQGEAGVGKRMLAEIFAQALVCENDHDRPCGVCRSCHQAETHNHPDIHYVTHERPALISVSEIRSQVVSDVVIRPAGGRYKIYIIEDAEKMNPQAQNALLKTLEEPPEYAVMLLLTVNDQALLETIRSRCVRLEMYPVRQDLVERYLMEHAQIPDYQARLCAAFAQGSIGRAMELARSENFAQIRSTALMIATRARQMDTAQIAQTVKEMAQYKLTINEFLDILAVWYRDVLYFKATRSMDALIFKDQLQQIRSAAQLSSYEGIEQILAAISTAKERILANVGFDLTMELLFLTIKEN